jgi:hypothetical protein
MAVFGITPNRAEWLSLGREAAGQLASVTVE